MSGTPSGTHSSPAPGSATAEAIDAAEAHSAHNYHPLPVVVASAEGAWMTDVDGKRYLDLLAGYSALNFGHANPRLIAAAKAQLDRVTPSPRGPSSTTGSPPSARSWPPSAARTWCCR